MTQAEHVPPVRVIIPAYNAQGSLDACLRALFQSKDAPDFEVVLVDEGGNGDLAALQAKHLASQEARAPFLPFRILVSETPGSAARARNMGAIDFEGDILVFLDADVVVHEDALAKLLRPIQESQAEASVGNYSTDIQGFRFAQSYKQLYIHHVYARKAGYIQREFWTALGAVRRDVFEAICGFGDEFQGACAEDTDFGYRLSEKGYRIYAVPDAQGRHLNDFRLLGLFRNDFQKGMATVRASLQKKNALTNNRHASRRDIVAVFLASLTALLVLLSFFSCFSLMVLPFSVGAYLALRADLLMLMSKQGLVFLVQASLLCFCLDLVRAASVGLGLASLLLVSKTGKA